MGQMTYGVLFGVKKEAPKSLGDDSWYALIEHVEEALDLPLARPSGDSSFDGIGFWCAVGASGKDGVPDLVGFPLDDFTKAGAEHRAALKKAKADWKKFAKWCSKPQKWTVYPGTEWEQTISIPALQLPEPRLYLVETEVV